MAGFLPVCQQDLIDRGISQLDYICVTGDAYVDHPTFGTAIISRVIESCGYTVGILAQPDWHCLSAFQALGKPRYAFLVNAGNVDSMVAHYTVAKNRRQTDAYSPGGRMGLRPDRAVQVYCQKIREAFGDHVPIVIGGIEASLRRFAHYDYWDDAVHPSILEESGANLLLYGMGELQITALVHRLAAGEALCQIQDLPGSCFLVAPKDTPWGAKECPSFAQVQQSKPLYAKACYIQMQEQDPIIGKRIIQRQNQKMLVQNPPMRPLSQAELDAVYELPYQRTYHPMYQPLGGVPGIQEVAFSVVHNRGCFGNCNFCAIALHQGRIVTARSQASVLKEVELLTKQPHFKGYIHDVGGPTANFRHPSCQKQLKAGLCRDRRCLSPTPCPNLEVDHREYCELLEAIRQIDGVRRVFVRSGVRYDYAMLDQNPRFLQQLIECHVSGQLKVAPEHCSNQVLDCMGKPHIDVYQAFSKKFYQITRRVGKEQYLVPYLMSSHPGSGLHEAIEVAEFLKKEQIRPEQVQDFYPTPGTVSTCMFYTGLDPMTGQPVQVVTKPEEKAMQRALLQYFKPNNRCLVEKALRLAHREDLIGTGPHCLIGPRRNTNRKEQPVQKGTTWRRKGRT